MSEWKEIKISDIADVNTQSINKNFKFPTIEYIDTSSVEKGRLVNIQIISIEDIPSRAKRRIKKNDVLISSVRPNLEHYYFVKNCKENTVVSTGFVVVSPKKEIYPYYLYCLLTTEQYTQYLTKVANSHTSTYPSFNPDIIYNSSFVIPDYPEQKRIADVLSCLDAKIENLKKQNNTLEQIAQTLFKHWFIDFEFPNTDGKPYKSSGGEMQSSILGDIPKGWRVGKLGDVVIQANTGADAIQKAPIVNENTGVKCLRIGDITNSRRLEEWGYCKITDQLFRQYQLKKGDILITRTSVLGLNILILEDLKAVFNNGLIKIRIQDKINTNYIYYSIQSKRYKDYIARITYETTTRPNMQMNYLLDFPLLLADKEIEEKFSFLASNILLKQDKNNKQIQTLTKIRDTLLPKLISGQIRIEE